MIPILAAKYAVKHTEKCLFVKMGKVLCTFVAFMGQVVQKPVPKNELFLQ